MRAQLLAIEKEAANSTQGPNALVVVTAPLARPTPDFDATRLRKAGLAGDLLAWEPAESEGESPWRVTGIGEAMRIDAAGETRISDAKTAGTALFEDTIERRAAGCDDVPAPRLYGGFRFAPQTGFAPRAEDPWPDFPDASLALPRWQILSRDDRCYVQLAVRAAELRERGAEPLISEFSTLERALHETEPSRVHSTQAMQLSELPQPEWSAFIEDALQRIASGDIAKVVAARQSRLQANTPFDIAAALSYLRANYPSCTRFIFQRGDSLFLGATPEKLVARCGDELRADALAGSRPRHAPTDDASDQSAKHELLHDDKERREHAYVVAAIRDVLARYTDDLRPAAEPSVRTLRNMHHLFTLLRGHLRPGDAPVHVLDLVANLHPTPAVCGVPRQAAARFLVDHEPTSRGWYASPIGWFNAAGEGQFCVALRCALVRQDLAWLFAGAGIVAGSNPEREYRETAAKQRVMLAALGSLA